MREDETRLLLLIIVATGLFSWFGFRDPALRGRRLLDVQAVLRRGQWTRMLTAALLHADWPHLLLNMYVLYSFGRYVEQVYGSAVLGTVYLAGVAGGSLVTVAVHRREQYRALGASGGVVGVVFASLFLLPSTRVVPFLLPVALPTWLFAVLYVGGSIWASRRRRDGIGHDAHLGGALGGLLAAAAWNPSIAGRGAPLFWLLVAGIGLFVLLAGWGESLGRGLRRRPDPEAWRRRILGLPPDGGTAARRRRPRGRRGADVVAGPGAAGGPAPRPGGAAGGRRDRPVGAREGLGPVDRARLDELLDRVAEVGIDGLPRRERQELEDLSRRLERRPD